MLERVNSIIKTVCGIVGETYGETPDCATLFSDKGVNVRRSVSAARQFSHYAMHCILGYSVTFIARMTGTTRNSVFRNVKKTKDLIGTDQQYRIINDKIKEKITVL